MNKEILPEKVTITCTDNGRKAEAHLVRYEPKSHMDLVVNTVKLKLMYKNDKLFVGNMSGLEFTCPPPEITVIKPFRR